MTTFCRFDYPSFVDFRMFNNTDCPFCTLIFMYNKNDNKKTFYKIAEKSLDKGSHKPYFNKSIRASNTYLEL